ncbi:MAG: hypothetical protein IKF52_05200 [Clostridia bacterium]|nr:hypothetical protein [Clostridia bacterium]
MKVKHEFLANSLRFEFELDARDIRDGFIKNDKISKYYRQIILNPEFNRKVKEIWQILDTEYEFNEYKEKVIDEISVQLFDAAISLCRKDLTVSLEDAIIFCIMNNIQSDGTHFMKLSDVEVRLLLENKKIDKAFSVILQDKDILQCINDIGRLSYRSDLRYMFLDGILCYAYYTACCLIVNELSLSLEQAVSNALEKESILGWLNEYKEYFM